MILKQQLYLQIMSVSWRQWFFGGLEGGLVSCEAELVFAPSFTHWPTATAPPNKLKMKGAILWRCGTTLCLWRISEEYRVWPSWPLRFKKGFNLTRTATNTPLPHSTSQCQVWGNVPWWIIHKTSALQDLQLRLLIAELKPSLVDLYVWSLH